MSFVAHDLNLQELEILAFRSAFDRKDNTSSSQVVFGQRVLALAQAVQRGLPLSDQHAPRQQQTLQPGSIKKRSLRRSSTVAGCVRWLSSISSGGAAVPAAVPAAAAMAQLRANHVVGFTPSTITICLSDGSFVGGISQRCDNGLYGAQLDLELPARDKAPKVRAFLVHI